MLFLNEAGSVAGFRQLVIRTLRDVRRIASNHCRNLLLTALASVYMVSARCGFTLVEVLIVVIVMAILAAAVIPQLTSSAEDAKRSAGDYNVGVLRSVIQTYKTQHAG